MFFTITLLAALWLFLLGWSPTLALIVAGAWLAMGALFVHTRPKGHRRA